MTFWKTSKFKELQKAWYERLRDEGFEDAEEIIAGELVLKQNAGHIYRDIDTLSKDCNNAYFRIIAYMVEKTKFKKERDRLILTRYAEGRKIREICEELEALGIRRSRGTIRYRIRIYEMRWGLKHYTPKQLNHLKV